PSLNNVIIALAIINWVGYARLVRGQVLKVREMEYVTAAKALGARSPRVILRHVLPNVINPIIVMATLGLAGVILAEAALSFLGFRQWTARDLDLAANIWGDADVTRFIGGPFSLSEIRTRLDREIAMAAATNVQYWPIFQLHDGAHAGCCGLRPYENEVNVYEL